MSQALKESYVYGASMSGAFLLATMPLAPGDLLLSLLVGLITARLLYALHPEPPVRTRRIYDEKPSQELNRR
jgi:hypothetical protein